VFDNKYFIISVLNKGFVAPEIDMFVLVFGIYQENPM